MSYTHSLISRLSLAGVLLLVLLGVGFATALPAPAQADYTRTWQLNLERLSVADAQEEGLFSDGDEPYFLVIGFRSRFNTPDSTRVFWSGYLNDEWANGVDDGDERDIPASMGEVAFADVDLVTLDQIRSGAMPELVGAVVIAFESDATPWRIIRGLMNDLQEALETELIGLIERGELDLSDPSADLRDALERVRSRTELNVAEKIRIWLASWSDPDDFIDRHFFLFAAVDPAAESLVSLPAVPGATLGTLREQRFALVFRGDGATYEVASSLTAVTTRAKGWVWTNQPTSSGCYTPSRRYQYSSSGGTNRICNLSGDGRYRVEFPGLATEGGMVQVASYGGDHSCKVSRWYRLDSDQLVEVRCFDAHGAPVDGRFTALFYKESRGATWRDAYLWADRPTASSYTPSPTYQWNSKGLVNTVRRLDTGYYQARLPGLDRLEGTVLVTAYGNSPDRCKVDSWSQRRGDTLVYVRCFNPVGSPIDARFTLSYLTDVALGVAVSEDQHYGGYVWADRPTHSGCYTPSSWYSLNTASPTNRVCKLAEGRYQVNFPLLEPANRTTALVTAYGSGNAYCTVSRWTGDDRDGTNVSVICFDALANPVDTRFTLTYLTDDQILY